MVCAWDVSWAATGTFTWIWLCDVTHWLYSTGQIVEGIFTRLDDYGNLWHVHVQYLHFMGIVQYHTLNFLLARKIIILAIHSLTHTYACTCTAAQLYAELSQLNLNLLARVCIPLYGRKHQVLRVPSSEAVVLNSKSKVHVCHCVHFTYTIYM